MDTLCKFEDCSKAAYKGSQGYCLPHYRRLRSSGELERKRAPHGQKTIKICIVDGCERDTSKGANGYCGMHYFRLKRHGTLESTYHPPSEELKQSIISDYESGESSYYIGKLHDWDPSKVTFWLTKWGVNKRLPGFQKGHNHVIRKGIKTDGVGYILLWKPEHPNARRGYVREHRLVMEEILGRYLTRDEVVHHINNDPSDNRPENLEVSTIGDHTRDHRVALGRVTDKNRSKVITLICDCCGKTYKRKIIKLCRPCRAPEQSVEMTHGSESEDSPELKKALSILNKRGRTVKKGLWSG